MTYPRDITRLVADLAATPGVHRVFVQAIRNGRAFTVSVWPAKYVPAEPIVLNEGDTLHVEGEWVFGGRDVVTHWNRLRAAEGSGALDCLAETAIGTARAGGAWSGDVAIGFRD